MSFPRALTCAAAVALAVGAASAPSYASVAPARTVALATPWPTKALIEENQSLAQMQTAIPDLGSLSGTYSNTSDWTASKQPSLPNHLGLTAGSTIAPINESSPSINSAKVPPPGAAGPRVTPRPTASTVTPEHFGAVGNGIADDTRAVQAAIDAAGSTKIVWLRANKTYLCKATITAVTGTNIQGAGPTSMLRFSWYDGAGAASKGASFLANRDKNTGNRNITLSNFVVAGTGRGLPAGLGSANPNGMADGIHLHQVATFSITHMEIRKIPGVGLEYSGSSYGNISYNHIHKTGRDGCTAFVGSANSHNDTVAYNVVEQTGDDAIAVNGFGHPAAAANHTALPHDFLILNNTIRGWTTDPNGKALGRGIAINGADTVLIQGNDVTFGQRYSLLVRGCNSYLCGPDTYDPATGQPWLSTNITVLNNTVAHTGGGYGIFIDTTRDTTVTGNTISNPGGTLIKNKSCLNCTVQTS